MCAQIYLPPGMHAESLENSMARSWECLRPPCHLIQDLIPPIPGVDTGLRTRRE